MSDLQCPARIVLARHGETEYESDRTGTMGGSLTVRGRHQARDLGERLDSAHVAAVVCSELSRSVQTAEIAAGVLGLPVRVLTGLHEFDVGSMHGQPFDATVAEPVMTAWRRGDLAASFPGGESGAATVRRVRPVLDQLADQFRGETVLVVTHGGVMLALLGLVDPDPHGDGELDSCATVAFDVDADGWRRVAP